MWKTVSARIRGAETELQEAGEDTEGMVKSTSKLRSLIEGMTGFDIMEDKDTFKDMKDIIVGIGKEWENLTDIDQSALLEALAGKNHSNSLAAALENYELIEQAYETAENSAGSAQREQEEYEKSLQFSIDSFKASLESLANSAMDSGLVKWFIDFGTTGVEAVEGIVNSIDKLNTLFGAATPFGELINSSIYGNIGALSGLVMNRMGVGKYCTVPTL